MSKIVSLFSGAGGFSLGFRDAGLQPSFAADINGDACATYELNLGLRAHNLDLGSEDDGELNRLLSPFRDCMAVIGGPPCQGFSTAGNRSGNDPRNQLVFRYLDVVDLLRPRWFLFENVEGILTSGAGKSLRDLAVCFIERGYTIRIEKINFAAFGLPQSRKRVLIMGNRIGFRFHFPAVTNSFRAGKHKSETLLPFGPSFSDAVADLPPPGESEAALVLESRPVSAFAASMRSSSTAVTHHYATPSASERARYALLQPGHTMKDLPEDIWHPSYRARAFRRVADGMPAEKRGGAPAGIRRLMADDAAPTITSAAIREFVHPTEDRALTLREAARLQSFPDDFSFVGPRSSIATQIGNAVPPLAAAVFAEHLQKLDGVAGSGRAVPSTTAGLLGYRLTDSVGRSPALQSTERNLAALPTAVDEGLRVYG